MRFALLSSVILTLISCDNNISITPPVSKLEQIKKAGVLQVATRLDPSTYYPLPEGGHSGLEYDLVMLFAKQLGVEVNFQTPNHFEAILQKTITGDIDIAAAGLTITRERKKNIRFAPPYHEVTEQVIYRSGTPRPKKVADLFNGILEITQGTSHAESLKKLKQISNPNLNWVSNKNLDSNQLLSLVNDGLIDYTVADSNQVILMRRFYPNLYVAFNISKPRFLAWALPLSDDDSLFQEVTRFFEKIKNDKTLIQLLDRHYGHAEKLTAFGKIKFYQHQKTRLPEYKPYFVETGKKYNIDWRLLAAIGYQESHWEKSAISPTGVRGIMMLTNNTAKQLGIKNRIDPKQSIQGGALYFHQRLKKIPRRVQEPDRTWFALASYNIGFGHLEDARLLTECYGSNPNKWIDVKKFLPKLSLEYWHKQTKHGYARGGEPVVYVENIRNYYDLLIWQHYQKLQQLKSQTTQLSFMDKIFETYFMLELRKRLTQKNLINQDELSQAK